MTDHPAVRRALLRLAAFAIIPLLVSGCATEDPLRQKRPPERKWYQSDMDSSERSFFVDTFFSNGR